MDNDFLLLLQAKLDEASSKGKINEDLVTIAKAIEKLKVQAEIDPNSVKNIAQQLSKIMNQRIVVDNIQLDTSKINKSGEQIGKNLGDSVNKSLNASLDYVKQNINDVIKNFNNHKLNSYDLSKMFNLNRANIDSTVIQQIRNLTNELNSLAKEALKTNSDSSWDGIVDKLGSLSRILNQFGANRDLSSFKESLDILNRFQGQKIFIDDKSEVLHNTGLTIKELNNEFRNLGVTFTTVSKDAIRLDGIWTELFKISPGLQEFNTFGDQINAIVDHLRIAKEALYGDKNLQPLIGNEVMSELLKWLENLENASRKVKVFREEQVELEQRIVQSSTSATDIIVQNEGKKQQAIRETAKTQQQVTEGKSLIKSGANVTTFEHTNNAAREASLYFKELLKDENAIITISEKFGKLNGLTSFTVNIQRASGEVESLRYSLEKVLDINGNATGESIFKNSGAEINNSGALRQVQKVKDAIADYSSKLAQFKSTNKEILSGLTAPLSDFESKLSGLSKGATTIGEVRNSFKMLNTEAAKILENFSSQFNKADAAIRKLASGDEIIKNLRAGFKGLDNTPKEINSELNKLLSGLNNIKKIESTEGRSINWAKAYKEWQYEVDVLTAKLRVLKKEQANSASTQVFKTSDLRKANIPYMTKVSNTIEKQMEEIQKMANAKGWQNFDVKGFEQADGLIKRLTLTATDAEGAIKKLNFQRQQLQGKGKAQPGLMQTGDVEIIKTAAKSHEELANSVKITSENFSTLKAKWEEQGLLVGEFKLKVEQMEASLASVGSKGELENLKAQIQTLKDKVSTVSQANKIQLSIETGDYDAKVESLIAKTRQWTDEFGNSKINTDALSNALKNLGNASKALSNNNTVENQKTLIAAEKELDNQIKKVTNSVKLMNSETMKTSAVDSLKQKYQEFYDKNGAAHRRWGAQLKQAMLELSSGADISLQRGKELEHELIQIQNAARQAGKLGKSGLQKLFEGFKSFGYWTSSTFLFMKAIQSVKNGLGTVKALDTALVDLKKTTSMTNSELEKFYYDSNNVAKQMGVTTAEIINQASAWSRLGYSSEEAASKMAKYSSMFASISPGMNVDTATDGLVSVMKAFDIGNDNPDDVLDGIMSKINIIGNTAATSNAEIVNMLTKSSSAMKEANNTLEETIALETAAVEITRDDASVGNAFKTKNCLYVQKCA